MEDNNKGFLQQISDKTGIVYGLPIYMEHNMFDKLNEINKAFYEIEKRQRINLDLLIKQQLESIEIAEEASIFKATNINGRGIIIIEIGDITDVHLKIIEAARQISRACSISVLEAVEMIEKVQHSMTIESKSFDSIKERIFKLKSADIEYQADCFELSEHISHHPKHMQCQRINYRSPVLCPGIVRRGKRQSYKQPNKGS